MVMGHGVHGSTGTPRMMVSVPRVSTEAEQGVGVYVLCHEVGIMCMDVKNAIGGANAECAQRTIWWRSGVYRGQGHSRSVVGF